MGFGNTHVVVFVFFFFEELNPSLKLNTGLSKILCLSLFVRSLVVDVIG